MALAQASRIRRLLESPRVGLVAIAIGVVLNLPSVPSGWHLDDLLHRAHFLEVGPLMDSSDMTNRMFDFLSGDPGDIAALKEIGVMPWWAYDEIRIRFWRPLSSFTHVVDYALWPNSGALMHLQNLAWLALLLSATSMLYRRLMVVPLVAGLASLLYALDDAHGLPTGFLANRNALVATALGVLSVVWLDRWRRDGWSPGAWLSPTAFGLALLGGESGIGAAPYLLGYAIFLESKSGARRLSSIVPHAVVGVVWLVVYKVSGYGTYGSGFYLDPVGQTGEWLSHFFIRAPLLLLGQWFLPPSSFAFAWSPSQAMGVAGFGVVVLAFILTLVWPILKRDPVARFLAFGMLLSVVPITAGFPHDRLLFFVGVGAMGLLAMLLHRLFDREQSPTLGRSIGWVLVLVHVFVAAFLQIVMTTAMAAQEPIYAGPARSLPDDAALERQKLIVVNPPSFFYGQYDMLVRRFDGRPAPQSLLMMAPGITNLTITRASETTLSIDAEDGFLMSAFDDVYRGRSFPVPRDYRLELEDVKIAVVGFTDDGRPRSVRFAFNRPLEDDSYRFVRYEAGTYLPFNLPPIGGTHILGAVPFSLISPNSDE